MLFGGNDDLASPETVRTRCTKTLGMERDKSQRGGERRGGWGGETCSTPQCAATNACRSLGCTYVSLCECSRVQRLPPLEGEPVHTNPPPPPLSVSLPTRKSPQFVLIGCACVPSACLCGAGLVGALCLVLFPTLFRLVVRHLLSFWRRACMQVASLQEQLVRGGTVSETKVIPGQPRSFVLRGGDAQAR